MERNKWEEEFKHKLNQREIAPTPHAWDRLDAMLNEADDKAVAKTPTRKINWLYIAAGIAGLLMVSLFFMKGDGNSEQNGVVETPKTEIPVDGKTLPTDNINQNEQTQIAETSPVQQPKSSGNTYDMRLNAVQKQTQIASVQPKSGNENIPIVNQEIIPEPKIDIRNPVNANADSQIASIETIIQSPKSVKVDARALLLQVDGELDMSFREKTIKTFNKNYQNVKVALANRNNAKE